MQSAGPASIIVLEEGRRRRAVQRCEHVRCRQVLASPLLERWQSRPGRTVSCPVMRLHERGLEVVRTSERWTSAREECTGSGFDDGGVSGRIEKRVIVSHGVRKAPEQLDGLIRRRAL